VLAAVLGVRYRQVPATDFMHSNVITLLDAQGNIVHRQEALGATEGTMKALEKLTVTARH
jgi:protein SCO1